MSLAALLKACRSRIRSQLTPTWREHEIDVQPDGRPIPSFGQRYVSIHPTGWSPGDITRELMHGLDETYSISATITKRASASAPDRMMGDLFLSELTGIAATCRQIALAIHQNYDLLTEANATIQHEDPGASELIEPLRWSGTDATPKLEGPEWGWAESNDKYPVAFLVMEVRFRDARRITTGEY